MRTEEEDENCFVLQAQKRGDGQTIKCDERVETFFYKYLCWRKILLRTMAQLVS